MTFARLARRQGVYHLTLVPGEIVRFDRAEMEAMGQTTTPSWPLPLAGWKLGRMTSCAISPATTSTAYTGTTSRNGAHLPN